MQSTRLPVLALAAVLTSVLAVLPATTAQGNVPQTTMTTVTYPADDGIVANPARGFFHFTETHYQDAVGTGWVPLDEATLRSWRAEGITQVFRIVYLDYFAGADGRWDLTPGFLRKVAADFATARHAGVQVVLRFAYAKPPDGVWPPPTPYGDAPVARTVHHIDQLGPTLRRNADVIATVQEGFIGLWGEGYYTDYFSDPQDPSVVTDANWADRARVLHALLDALPKSLTVEVRTPYMKQRIFDVPTGTGGALTPDEAFSGTDLSRVGHHNDCFLASADDFGTFLSDPISLDEDYLGADSRFVPVGGETCAVNPPKSEWPSARSLMEKFHFSYLNADYNTDVLDSWGSSGLAEARNRLGYRFTLLTGTFSTKVRPGGHIDVALDVRNDGFATPYQERPAQLVLTNGHRTYWLPLSTDPRRWTAGTTTQIRADVALPRHIEMGRYQLALALPSAWASVASNPDYAIRTANVGTWDAAHGWNNLGATVRVTGDTRR